LDDGHEVAGVDSVNDYYDARLKRARLERLAGEHFESYEFALEDKVSLDAVFQSFHPEIVIHLAAQAGVRYSIDHPHTYVSSNLVGTFNLLEATRNNPVEHLLLASSSSVYGADAKVPFSERDPADHPVSLYAATKKATESLAHSYAHLYKIATTCFRFFTVYGPWGRPDMALFKFVTAIEAGRPIDVYGKGMMLRDFTYIDDLVESISRLKDMAPVMGSPVSVADSLSPVAPFRVVNIGGGTPVGLMEFISAVEGALGVTAVKNMLPMQPGDVPHTSADPTLLRALVGAAPATPIRVGVQHFVDWLRSYEPRP
jgi:UDP-glucuronate 4-epimerase